MPKAATTPRPLLHALLLAALAGVGCNQGITSVFPPGLTPVDPVDTAPLPTPVGSDQYPESITFVRGTAHDGDFVHARGYVKAPLATVWSALKRPEVCTDRRKVDKYSFTLDAEAGYRVSFIVHNEVDAFLTVTFDNTWRQDVQEGTADAPTVVVGVWQKTQGSDFISLLHGSFTARRVDDQTTELDLMEHLNAAQGGADNIQSFLQDIFTSVVAVSHGQPLPTFK